MIHYKGPRWILLFQPALKLSVLKGQFTIALSKINLRFFKLLEKKCSSYWMCWSYDEIQQLACPFNKGEHLFHPWLGINDISTSSVVYMYYKYHKYLCLCEICVCMMFFNHLAFKLIVSTNLPDFFFRINIFSWLQIATWRAFITNKTCH